MVRAASKTMTMIVWGKGEDCLQSDRHKMQPITPLGIDYRVASITSTIRQNLSRNALDA